MIDKASVIFYEGENSVIANCAVDFLTKEIIKKTPYNFPCSDLYFILEEIKCECEEGFYTVTAFGTMYRCIKIAIKE